MREITSHKVNGLNEAIQITCADEKGPGGANHLYKLDLIGGAPDSGGDTNAIRFQVGPISEYGVNGISNESLLAVVIDRLQCFQNGEYKCRENAIALTHLEDAMHWLQHRTRARMQRGVEGTSNV